MNYLLLGKNVVKSDSKRIHALLGNNHYALVNCTEKEIKEILLKDDFVGANITMPFKKSVLPLLDFVEEKAKEIGCVNTVIKDKNGKLLGYNTDYFGLFYLIKHSHIDIKGKNILILGNGATSKTSLSVLSALGAKTIDFVSRQGKLNYQNVYEEKKDIQIIVNTTPVGMFEDLEASPVSLHFFPNCEAIIDVIYSPIKTRLQLYAREKGLKYIGGLLMLVAQAAMSDALFFEKKEPDDKTIDTIYTTLLQERLSIALIGMPGCGKTTVAKEISKITGRKVYDIDERIEKKENMSIEEIFSSKGESYFREAENKIIREMATLNGIVLALGGGSVQNEENSRLILQNAFVVYIKRDLDLLATKGRPLSGDIDTLKKIYEERKENYLASCDVIVENDCTISELARKIMEKFNEYTGA